VPLAREPSRLSTGQLAHRHLRARDFRDQCGRPRGQGCASTKRITGRWPWNLPSPWLPPAAHARLAHGRARAAAAVGLRFRPPTLLVECWLARSAALAAAVRSDLVVERDAHLVEIGLVHLAIAAAHLTPARFARRPSPRGG